MRMFQGLIKIYLKIVSDGSIDNKAALIQVMSRCFQATSPYGKQCWQILVMPYGITWALWCNWAFKKFKSGKIYLAWWKHFPHYWPFVRGIHRSPVNSPHKGQWRGALMFSVICARINSWVNNRKAGDLRCHQAHYNVTVMHGCSLTMVFR